MVEKFRKCQKCYESTLKQITVALKMLKIILQDVIVRLKDFDNKTL